MFLYTILLKRLPSIITLGALLFVVPARTHAADIRSILFPVLNTAQFSDDFGASRVGHTHEGNDLFANKLQPLIAAVTGFIRFVAYPEPSWGYAIYLEDAAGYRYRYLHVNNDTPGTDDGNGSSYHAYAPDVLRGLPVVQGQLIGWVGDSGNAEQTSPHLHFEIRRPDGNAIDPFQSLKKATHIIKPVVPPPLPEEMLPFGQFSGGGSITVGAQDPQTGSNAIVVGAAEGGGPLIRVYSSDMTLRTQFFAYGKSFRGGIDVAVADTNGDGTEEIITVSGSGMPGEVRIFSMQGVLMHAFTVYAGFHGGLHVAAADLDRDGKAEIITGPMKGGGPQVSVFDGTGSLRTQFFAYGKSFRGGIDVTAAPATEATQSAIITSPGAGGGPHVRVFSAQGAVLTQFFPAGTDFRGGIRVAVAEMNSATDGPEILTAPANDASPDFRVYGMNGVLQEQRTEFEPWWQGGYDIAANNGFVAVASGLGGRRTSVRIVGSPFGFFDFRK